MRFSMKLLVCSLLLFSTNVWGQAPVMVCTNFGCGFFSAFNTVVGLLDSYEQGEISGIEIKMGTAGLYYDEAKGPNWWSYYFEPFPMQINDTAPRMYIDGPLYCFHSLRGCVEMSKHRCNYLVNKYIKIRPEILKEVEVFLKKKVKNQPFVGVHYRGTDKILSKPVAEAEYLSPEEAVLKIKQGLLRMPECSTYKIFVATDDQSFLDLMKQEFGKRVCYFEMERSTDGQPIHERGGKSDGYLGGKMVLLDCLVLSRSDFFFRTSSNLGGAVITFNPSLPSIFLNRALGGYER